MQHLNETQLAAMVDLWRQTVAADESSDECTRCRAEATHADELCDFINDMEAAHALLEVAYAEPDEEIAAVVRATAYRIHVRAHSLLPRAVSEFAFLSGVDSLGDASHGVN